MLEALTTTLKVWDASSVKSYWMKTGSMTFPWRVNLSLQPLGQIKPLLVRCCCCWVSTSFQVSHLILYSSHKQFLGGIARGPIEAIRRPRCLFSDVPEGFNKLTAGSYSLKQSRGGRIRQRQRRWEHQRMSEGAPRLLTSSTYQTAVCFKPIQRWYWAMWRISHICALINNIFYCFNSAKPSVCLKSLFPLFFLSWT